MVRHMRSKVSIEKENNGDGLGGDRYKKRGGGAERKWESAAAAELLMKETDRHLINALPSSSSSSSYNIIAQSCHWNGLPSLFTWGYDSSTVGGGGTSHHIITHFHQLMDSSIHHQWSESESTLHSVWSSPPPPTPPPTDCLFPFIIMKYKIINNIRIDKWRPLSPPIHALHLPLRIPLSSSSISFFSLVY